jgi:hypothetical protein
MGGALVLPLGSGQAAETEPPISYTSQVARNQFRDDEHTAKWAKLHGYRQQRRLPDLLAGCFSATGQESNNLYR